MPSLVFDTCCCCIELKTGCFIYGYLNLLGSVIGIITTVIDLVGCIALQAEADERTQEVAKYVVIYSAIMLPFYILFLFFTIALLNGLHANKPGHVKAFIIYAAVFSVLSLIPYIILIAGGHAQASVLVIVIIAQLLNVYFLLVIRSQYYRMLDPNNGACVYNADA